MEGRGFKTKDIYERFRIGFADGGLLTMPDLDKEKLKYLKEVGVVRENTSAPLSTGNTEHFFNCITFPIFDHANRAVGIYGRSISQGARVKHLYLKGKHKGVFNREASAKYDEVILTESIIDALSLITMGVENAQSIYGTNGFTEEHLELLKNGKSETIIIGFDNDKAGIKTGDDIKERLLKEGFKVKVIFPPLKEGELFKDWNEYLAGGGEAEAVKDAISEAEIFGEESGPEDPESSDEEQEDRDGFSAEKDGARYIFRTEEITYRVSGIKDMFAASLRVNVKAELNRESTEIYYDTLNLYSAKSRSAFSASLGRVFFLEPRRIEKDLVMMLEYLEKEWEENMKSDDTKDEKDRMTEEDIKLGMDFLKNPDIFDEILKDMNTLGYIGEDLNKLLMYIAASSRKLDDPMSVLVMSQSASGKSMLVDSIKALIPEEDVIAVTSLSDQALNYIKDLNHKFLTLGEAVHSEVIEHQLREMLSSRELSRLVTMKNESTGQMESQLIKTKAIVATAMSTTDHNINPENASRYFMVHTDESKEQTRRIHEAQRGKYTLERVNEKTRLIPQIIRKHHAAQRLLKKVIIINPFSEYLDFPANLMRTRRDHDRFIDLITCICFIRQYQKEAKLNDGIRHIECDLIDYKTSFNIMINGVLSSTMMELPQGVMDLYEQLRDLARKLGKEKKLCPEEVSFTQREIREKTGLGHNWVKKNLRILVDYEYLTVVKGGGERTKGHYSLREDAPIEELNLSMIPSPEEVKKMIEEGEKLSLK